MSISGEFGVDATGAATYTVPITVPPGTAGMVPSLTLEYSSQNGDGVVGLGWSLSGLPAITRCPRTLAQDGVHGGVNYDSNDRYCMDGQRLISIGTVSQGTLCNGTDTGTEYRTEIDSFNRIVSCGVAGNGPAYFKVWAKSGQRMEFGVTTDSRVLAVGKSTVRTWAVNKISDIKGNYISVTYNGTTDCPDSKRTTYGEICPTRIDYTGTGSFQPYNSVRLTYESRPDSVPTYQAGSLLQMTVRLSHIKTYERDNVVLDYQLTYNADASTTKRSRLVQLRVCDGSGATCLAPTTFGWQGSRDSWPFGTPIPNGQATGTAGATRIFPGDYNGDGLTDVIIGDTDCSPPVTTVFKSDSQTAQTGQFVATGDTHCFLLGNNTFILDYNGDGIMDVRYRTGPDSSAVLQGNSNGIFTSVSGSGFNADTQRGVTTDFNGDGYSDLFTNSVWFGNGAGQFEYGGDKGHVGDLSIGIPADYDGDGCTDMMRQGFGDNHDIVYFCSPAIEDWDTPDWAEYELVLGDYNGDGKTDVLAFGGGTDHGLYLSTGTSLTKVADPTIAGTRFAGDWNGDGRTDVAAIIINPEDPDEDELHVYFSTGTSFIAQPVLIGDFNGLPYPGDWNSDGATDIWRAGITGGSLIFTSPFVPELMTSISNGIGVTTTITYDRLNKNGSFYTKESGDAYPTIDLDGPMYAVSRVDTSNGIGGTYSTTYAYAGAKADHRGRGFLGFHTRTATDLQTNIIQTTTYLQTYPYVGLVERDAKSLNGVELYAKTNTFGSTNQGGTRRFVFLVSSVEATKDYDGSSTYPMPKVVTLFNGYDSYGNIGQVVVCTKMKFQSTEPNDTCDANPQNWDATYVGVKVTDNTFNSPDTANWIIGRLLTASTTAKIPGASPQQRNASFTYDLGGGTPSGLLTSEFLEPGNCSYALETHYDYDAFGNRQAVTLRNPASCTTTVAARTTTVAYSTSGNYRAQFATSVTNALNFTESWNYNLNFGTPSDHTGPNGVVTTWTYDVLGRRTFETRADGTRTKTEYLYCSGVNGGTTTCTPANAAFVVKITPQRTSSGNQNGAISWTYFDALGRVVAQDIEGFDGTVIRVATEYDSKGRVLRMSRPYFVSGSPLWVTNTYDVLSRVSTTTGADGIVTKNTYQGLTTSVTADFGTDHKNQVTTTVRNGYGQVTQVTDADGGVTAYTYDPFGAVSTYTDADSHTTNFTYDIRGRKTVSDSPDMGHWTYSYDVLDQLTSQTDAKTQQTTLQYDVLGRLKQQVEGNTTNQWLYDCPEQTNCQNHPEYHALGKLITARWTKDGGATYPYNRNQAYDTIGRPNSATITIDGTSYSFATTYDNDGRVDTITDPTPSAFVERRVYNSRGYLRRLEDATGGGSTILWRADQLNASLQLTQETQGNGVVVTSGYQATTDRLTSVTAGPGGGSSIANYSYTYDAIGNLATRTDSIKSFNETFGYDPLNRLTSYQVNSRPAVAVTYSAGGNVLTRSDIGTYTYSGSGAGPQAVTSIASCSGCTVNNITNPTFTYDANGAMTAGAGRTYTLTDFNMVSRIVSNTARADFDFGPEHQKVRQITRLNSVVQDTTVFLDDPVSGIHVEVFTPQGGTTEWRHYLSANGRLVGVRSWSSGNAQWRFFVLDHLGSVSVLTNASGTAVQRLSYDVWGRRRCDTPSSSGSGNDYSCAAPSPNDNHIGFTGHDMLDLVGLIDMRARTYDPTIGRFLSADSIVPDPFSSQSLNRYSYVYNNPLSFADPTGHEPFSIFVVENVLVTAARFAIPVIGPLALAAPLLVPILFPTPEPVFFRTVTVAPGQTTASGSPSNSGNQSGVAKIGNTATPPKNILAYNKTGVPTMSAAPAHAAIGAEPARDAGTVVAGSTVPSRETVIVTSSRLPPAGQINVQLGHYAIEGTLGLFEHSFLKITGPQGQTVYFRGGPTRPGGSASTAVSKLSSGSPPLPGPDEGFGQLHIDVGTEANPGVAADLSRSPEYRDLGNFSISFDEAAARLESFGSQINTLGIRYELLHANSNTAAFSALDVLGVPRPLGIPFPASAFTIEWRGMGVGQYVGQGP